MASAGAPARRTRLQPVATANDRAKDTATLAAQADARPAPPLDNERDGALAMLYKQALAGAPFAQEEIDILRRWYGKSGISELEADLVISRGLYAYYIAHTELTYDQAKLLSGYEEVTARRERAILDAKAKIAAEEAAAWAANPREPQGGVANDQCIGAIPIPGGGPFPVCGAITPDITAATTVGDPPIPSCTFNGGPVSRSVWYTFTPANTGFYRVTLCADQGSATTVDDTVLGIYTTPGGCAIPFTELPTTIMTDGCDDDSCVTESLQSFVDTTLTSGTTYYIVIWKFDTPAPTVGNTAVQPCIQLLPTPPTPANDTCASATPLTLNIPAAGFTTGFTTNDYQLPAASPCFPAGHTASTATGRDVVYSFTAPAGGQYSFRAWQYVSTGTSNVVAYVASTCPPATPGTPVTVATCLSAANIQSSTGGEEVNCLSLSAGQQVFFFVDEAAPGAGGTFYALVEPCGTMESEPNNTPAQAGPLACGIQGQVNPATEADFYSLGTPATGSRVFAMVDASTAGTSADVDLRVNTATDTLEFDDLSNDVQFGVSGFSPNIAGFNATGVPLFLQVDRFGAAPSGIANPYRLYSVVQPTSAAATPETEPNDTTASPTVAVNNYFSGALGGTSPSTDVDIYAFDATAGDLIMLNVDGDPERNNTPVDTRLELLNSAGMQLVNVNGSAGTNTLDNANPPGLFESQPVFVSEALLFRAQTTGRFFARVTAGSTSATTAAGNYLLSISKNCLIGGGIAPTAELTLTKTDSPDPVPTGSDLTYTITLMNAGPLAATNVSLSDIIPTGTTFVSFTAPAGWTSTTPAVGGTGTVTSTNPSVAAGATAVFTLVVNVNAAAGATVTNTATVTQSTAETNTADNTATATTTVGLASGSADVSITKADSPDPVVTGATLTYTLTVTNAGPNTATNVTVTDNLPAQVTFTNCTATGGGVCGGTGNNRTVTFASLGVTSETVTFTATVNCNVTNGTVISNTATVNAPTNPDPTPGNNTSTTTTTASNPPPTITCPANITTPANTTQGTQTGAIVNYPNPTVTDNCPSPAVACVPGSGTFFPVGTTTVTCTATDSAGATASCNFTVTVTSAFTACCVDDATGNTISIVADPASPLFGVWTLRIAATGQVISGNAEFISYYPGRALIAYDHDNPDYVMDLNINFGARTCTATVKVRATGTTFVIRDRNIANNPPCAG